MNEKTIINMKLNIHFTWTIILFLPIIFSMLTPVKGKPYSITPSESIQHSEDIIEQLSHFPQLKKVCLTLYGYDGFNEEEKQWIKILIKIYNNSISLKNTPAEDLIHWAFWGSHFYGSPDSFKHIVGLYHYNISFFNSTVLPLANSIVKNASNQLEAVKLIIRWVQSNIKYNMTCVENFTVENTLINKRGVCGHFAVTIVALCKAVGIPARVVSGWYYYGQHGWEECYINGSWIPFPSTPALDYHEPLIFDDDDIKYWGGTILDAGFTLPINGSLRAYSTTLAYNHEVTRRLINYLSTLNLNEYQRILLQNASSMLKLYWDAKSIKEKLYYNTLSFKLATRVLLLYKYGVEFQNDEIINIHESWDENLKSRINHSNNICLYGVTGNYTISARGYTLEFPLELLEERLRELRSLNRNASIYIFLPCFDSKRPCPPNVERPIYWIILNQTEVETLSRNIFDSFFKSTPSLLKSFVERILQVNCTGIPTDFIMPQTLEGVRYKICAMYHKHPCNAPYWKLLFSIYAYYNFSGAIVSISYEYPENSFDNIFIVTRDGKIILSPPYVSIVYVHIIPPQSIIIKHNGSAIFMIVDCPLLSLSDPSVKYAYNETKVIRTRLLDQNKVPYVNCNISFKIYYNQNWYTLGNNITNKEGWAELLIGINLPPGIYPIQASFAGDFEHNLPSASSNGTLIIEGIIIDQVYVSNTRAEVGSTQTIGFHAKLPHNYSNAAKCEIYINGTKYVTDNMGWVRFNIKCDSVGLCKWVVNGVNHQGLTAYEKIVSDPYIIWDKIIVKASAESTIPGSLRMMINLNFEYDDEPIKDALVKVNNVKAKEVADGVYEVTLSTWSPLLRTLIYIEKIGFKPLEIQTTNYVMSNIVFWVIMTILTIIMVTSLILKKKGLKS